MGFKELGLTESLEEAINNIGYQTPTPIQEKAIPFVLMGKDVLACAQTGTGKTGAFLLPIVDILRHTKAKVLLPRVIIIEPTRELAAQVQEIFDRFCPDMGLRSALVVGGEFWGEQDKLLKKGVDVIIGTPGRLYDLIERQKVIMADINIVVIDEADRLLDMGFFPDIERILSFLTPSKKRQTLLFSATLPKEVQDLSSRFMDHPFYIESAPKNTTAETIKQYAVMTTDDDKRSVTRNAIKHFKAKKIIVFCNRKSDVSILQSSMKKRGYAAEAIHGDLDQSKRTLTLERFRENKFQILIASDVVARGVDVTDIDLVINFDIPINPEDYIHRIGRTGRAGAEGTSLTLYTAKTKKQLKKVEVFIKQDLEQLTIDLSDPIDPPQEPKTKKQRFSHDRQETIVGFGDHIPAFFKVTT